MRRRIVFTAVLTFAVLLWLTMADGFMIVVGPGQPWPTTSELVWHFGTMLGWMVVIIVGLAIGLVEWEDRDKGND